jgi:hypothetical protein
MLKIRDLLRKITHNRYAHYYALVQSTKKALNAEEIILIHQMGKVGSTAIWASLENCNLKQPILHTHILHPDYFKIKDRQINVFDYGYISAHEVTSYYIRQLLDQASRSQCFSRAQVADHYLDARSDRPEHLTFF